ncbi:hypothetical protein ACFE04_001380 [Oxalis oulophora]
MKSDDDHHRNKLIKLAISSRLLVVTLIFFWRTLISPYDTSSLINPNCLNNVSPPKPQPSILWPTLAAKIEGSIVWDAVYFVRIAQCGYEYEQTYAFLPLLPICISFLSNTVLSPLIPLIGHRAVLALAGYFVNNVAFVFAVVYLYRLSVIVLKNRKAAFRASVLFCFNPASIFYSSIYAESLYALFSIGGVYHLVSGASNFSVLWFALSGCARSNGVINVGYLCFQAMHKVYQVMAQKKGVHLALQVIVAAAFHCICVCVPFIAYQAYGYYNICHGSSPDGSRPWGVGFLRYFQFKQLPNFLLASPILSSAFYLIIYYVKSRPEILMSLSFCASVEEKSSAPMFFSLDTSSRGNRDRLLDNKSSSLKQENCNLRLRKPEREENNSETCCVEHELPTKTGLLSPLVLPFVLHLGFLAATAFFVMHVQVSTRFLSASPPLYWFASYLMELPGVSRKWGYAIWAYSAAYFLLGSLLFSTFYPFT